MSIVLYKIKKFTPVNVFYILGKDAIKFMKNYNSPDDKECKIPRFLINVFVEDSSDDYITK